MYILYSYKLFPVKGSDISIGTSSLNTMVSSSTLLIVNMNTGPNTRLRVLLPGILRPDPEERPGMDEVLRKLVGIYHELG